MILLYIILGVIIGGLVCFLYLRPRIRAIDSINFDIKNQNEEIEQTNHDLNRTLIDLKQEIALKQYKKNELNKTLDEIQDQVGASSQLARRLSQQQEEMLGKALEAAAEKASREYQQAEKEYQKEYINSLNEYSQEFQTFIKSKRQEKQELEKQLQILKSAVQAAVEANIREEEKKKDLDFYKIGLTPTDINEVQKLREVTFFLRNDRPINKAIWEAYYRNLTTDMVNRVVGAGTHSGIYRITNLLDNKIYIGQSTSIGERFKAHIKCGLGIDAPSNKLYIAMKKDGVENFTFEVLEECNPVDLNEKEKYWIQYYQSNIYGYNMSIGGSRAN